MNKKIPHILIIIVTWNKKQYVLDLLSSIQTLQYSGSALDIVVVDNASNDSTTEAIRQDYPEVNLICNTENLGGTGGFNTGLQWAFEQPLERYQYLWLLDNDVLVHHHALNELVEILENNPDIGVAGSTMMQLDYPWRINEMGAFVNLNNAELVLNRHLEEITYWQGYSVEQLLTTDADLSKKLMHCPAYMDVDYVAAASLMIRVDVARQAGIWRDYFIHFDDVEWCLRIGEMGHRVVVSAKSLIWHLSAAAKVPTWILYYDNRNVLDMMKTHHVDSNTLNRQIRYVYKKAVYYHLIGKAELAQLHYDALNDFTNKRFGKKNINLSMVYQKKHYLETLLADTTIKHVLISWAVNLHATDIQEMLVKILAQRPDLEIFFMPNIENVSVYQLPRAKFIAPLPKSTWRRWLRYWQMRGHYDLVIQSDYQSVIGLSWLKAKLVFINDEGLCQLPQPQFKNVIVALKKYVKALF